MRIKFTETEIYDVIIMDEVVLVLTDVDEDLTFNGQIGAKYETDETMDAIGLGFLVGVKRIYPFGLNVVGHCLIED